ncbi:host attachment protein [Caulobacter zeae]|nr:host attachment protein [Caulobacter zeae]
MRADERTLVVTADGVHARCFEERRQGGRLIEHPEWLDPISARPRLRSATGAVHDRKGHAHHETSPAPPEDQVQEQFWARLAERIGVLFKAERFDALVLLAPPRALGRLRERLAPAIRGRLVLDAPRDLVKETDEALRRRLRELRFHAA